jgi:hypothetical protein
LSREGLRGLLRRCPPLRHRRLAALGKKRLRANAATCKHPRAPSARELAFGVMRQPKQRQPEEQARVDILRGISEEFREVLTLAEELAAMLRQQSATSPRLVVRSWPFTSSGRRVSAAAAGRGG